MKTENNIRQHDHSTIPQKIKAYLDKEDYEAILKLPLDCALYLKVDDRPFVDCAVEILEKCPVEILSKYPLSLMRIAYVLYGSGKHKEYEYLTADIKEMISVPDIPDNKQRQLMGEWAFISALTQYPRIKDMLELLEKADELTDGHVEVMNADTPFLFVIAAPFATFNITPGEAEEEGRLYAEFASLYEKLTGGGGAGSIELYEAGLSYYRGDFKQAELLCYKSAYLAESKRQSAVQIGAARLLAMIGIHKMDMAEFERAVQMQDQAAAQHPEYESFMKLALAYERTDLYFEVSVTDFVPEWIQSGSLDIFPEPTLNALKYAQLRYFFYTDKHEQCIGLGEALLKHWTYGGVLVKATVGMYVAFSYLALGHKAKGIELFQESFAPMFNDGLYLVFTYYYENMDGALDDYLKENYPGDCDAIFALMEKNRQGRLTFMRTYLAQSNPLTKKEKEVAELAAEGLHNKEISEELGISTNTVRTHLRKIFEKLDIDRRSEIIRRLK